MQPSLATRNAECRSTKLRTAGGDSRTRVTSCVTVYAVRSPAVFEVGRVRSCQTLCSKEPTGMCLRVETVFGFLVKCASLKPSCEPSILPLQGPPSHVIAVLPWPCQFPAQYIRSLHDHPHPTLGSVPAFTRVTHQLCCCCCCCCFGADQSAADQEAQPATARVSLSVPELRQQPCSRCARRRSSCSALRPVLGEQRHLR